MKSLLLLLILFQLNKSNQLPYYKYAIMNEEINNFTTYIYDRPQTSHCPSINVQLLKMNVQHYQKIKI
jgi:hypothetical protein